MIMKKKEQWHHEKNIKKRKERIWKKNIKRKKITRKDVPNIIIMKI